MSHLSAERLAALADESPNAGELAHLASCGECARERAVFQSLAELSAAESARIGVPLSSWSSLRPALVADGIIDRPIAPGVVPVHLGWVSRRHGWLQAAAAVLLVAGGVAVGRYTAGASMVSAGRAATVAKAELAGDTTVVPQFASVDQARAARAQAQLLYQTATAFLAQSDTANPALESPDAIRTRLAALDRASNVIGQALNEAPYDPVINGYYLTTVGQRDATLRQLNTVLPASMRIQSY